MGKAEIEAFETVPEKTLDEVEEEVKTSAEEEEKLEAKAAAVEKHFFRQEHEKRVKAFREKEAAWAKDPALLKAEKTHRGEMKSMQKYPEKVKTILEERHHAFMKDMEEKTKVFEEALKA